MAVAIEYWKGVARRQFRRLKESGGWGPQKLQGFPFKPALEEHQGKPSI